MGFYGLSSKSIPPREGVGGGGVGGGAKVAAGLMCLN